MTLASHISVISTYYFLQSYAHTQASDLNSNSRAPPIASVVYYVQKAKVGSQAHTFKGLQYQIVKEQSNSYTFL